MIKLPKFASLRAKTVTSADARAEIERHESMLAEAHAVVAGLDGERRAALLSDDPAVIASHEAKAADARLDVDRLVARIEVLKAQEVEIAKAAAAAALDAKRADVADRAEQAARWLAEAYPELARELVSGLASLEALEQEIAGLNQSLTKARRDESALIDGVQARLGIRAGNGTFEAGSPVYAGSAVSLTSATKILALEGGATAPGWLGTQWK